MCRTPSLLLWGVDDDARARPMMTPVLKAVTVGLCKATSVVACGRILENMELHSLNDVAEKTSGDHDKGRRKSRRLLRHETIEEAESNVEVAVTFLPNAEGELKDIPGFGQVLETRSLEDGKVIRYPISALGNLLFCQ